MGKSLAPQSIVHDRNEISFDKNLSENYVGLKVKPLKAINYKDNSLWYLMYKFYFIITFLWERFHSCPELIEALDPKNVVESKNV